MRNLRVQNCAGLLLVAIINPALAQAHPGPQAPVSETALVTPDNFNRAETDMYFGGSVKEGGLGTFRHNREAIPIDKQMVIRMNRDTLYSLSVFDPRCWTGNGHTAQFGPAFHVDAGDR